MADQQQQTQVAPPKTAVEKRNEQLASTTHDLLKKLEPAMAKVLPKHLTPERMAMIAFTAMRRTPKLMECSQASIIGSIMTAAMLGLEPSGPLGQGALIPYGKECQFQPMYQGLLELARRSGLIMDVQAREVREGDEYSYRFGLDPDLIHVPLEGDRAADPDRRVLAVYCVIRFMNGGRQWDQMSMDQAIAHARRFSPSWDPRAKEFDPKSAWAKHPEAMALKTIIKKVLKMCPKSTDMAQAMMIDDMSEMGISGKSKQRSDGSYEVDFSDAFSEEGDLPPRGTVTSEAIRQSESGENRGHHDERLDERQTSHAGNGGNGGQDPEKNGPQPQQQQERQAEPDKPLFARPNENPQTRVSEADMKLLEGAMRTHKVDYDAFVDKVRGLGFKVVSHLTYAHFQSIGEWIRKGGRDS